MYLCCGFPSRIPAAAHPGSESLALQAWMAIARASDLRVRGNIAFAFLYPNAELALMFIPVPIKAKYFVPGILAVDLFLGLKGGSIFGSTSGIAHFAHIGGALTGFLMMWYWKKNQFNRNRRN